MRRADGGREYQKQLRVSGGLVDVRRFAGSKRVNLYAAVNRGIAPASINATGIDLTPSEVRRVISALQAAIE